MCHDETINMNAEESRATLRSVKTAALTSLRRAGTSLPGYLASTRRLPGGHDKAYAHPTWLRIWRRVGTGLPCPPFPETGIFRFFAALFPIAQSAQWNVKARSKLFLAQAKRTPNDFDLRGTFHASYVLRRDGLSVRICQSGSMALLIGHSIKSFPVMVWNFLRGICVFHRVRISIPNRSSPASLLLSSDRQSDHFVVKSVIPICKQGGIGFEGARKG